MKRKIDNFLFNGYIREPLPMVILALLVGIVFLSLSIWATVELFYPPVYESATKETQFVEYKQDGVIYSLISLDGDIYDLPVASINKSDILDSLINDEVLLLVEYIPTEKETSLDILSVTSLDGKYIISFHDISVARLNSVRVSTLAMWTASLIYWMFISASYYFISHAPRYPRVAKLLVRESFRNF